MKNTFFQKNKKALWIAGCILGFALVTLLYFYPIVEGKRIGQSDIMMYKGMSKEAADYYESTGQQTLWTNSMFGGMPTWNIRAYDNSNLMRSVNTGLNLGFPHPIGAVFISMLGFFLLLLVLGCNVGTSFIGGLAYGFTSYLFIIIGAGHNTKAYAMAYMAPVLAGVILTYKGKYLWGTVLTAIALALEIRANHLQITYYLLLILIILIVAELISDIREKRLLHFAKATVLIAGASILAAMTYSTTLYANYVFGKETTRGKPVLTSNQDNQTDGLDRDYITDWSYGIGETWSLLIPNAKGGATGYIGKDNPALNKVSDPRFKQLIAGQNAYWGDQRFTSGPVYVGAIVVFLFVLGALCAKGKLKWVLLIATVLSILLAWGKNFLGFTNFFIDYIPGYSKFRSVSMTLVIAEVCMPLLGFLGLAELLKHPDNFKKNQKKFFIALGITAGICLLFLIAPKLFFSFLSQNEAQQYADAKPFVAQLEDVRMAIFRKDALRSLAFILLAAIPIFLYGKGKLKAVPTCLILGALVTIDMLPIDRRYLNNDNYITKQQAENPFQKTVADQEILKDTSLDFRVFHLDPNVFNNASISYYHKSVGGYHGAKLHRYQDLISASIVQDQDTIYGLLGQDYSRLLYDAKVIQQCQDSVKTAIEKYQKLEQEQAAPELMNDLAIKINLLYQENDRLMECLWKDMETRQSLNMLNTKYIIYNPNSKPYENRGAFGNAWMVNKIRWTDSPNDEFAALEKTDLRHTAVMSTEFESQLADFQPDGEGSIELTKYEPNQLTYHFEADSDQLVVFSEIWTSQGWTLKIDGKEEPLLRANYVLRAAKVPAGAHEIVMRYEPKIWKVGNTIQLVSSTLLLLGLIAAIVFTFIKKKKEEQA